MIIGSIIALIRWPGGILVTTITGTITGTSIQVGVGDERSQPTPIITTIIILICHDSRPSAFCWSFWS